jgi:hypothetical protein
MSRLTIRMKKKTDGSAAISCERPDGSVTWQRQEGRMAGFFPLHDLTHFAVETVLEHRRGFYGLIADGWDFTDFTTPWPRGPIPADADPSELIVGFFDAERVGGERWSAEQFNAHGEEFGRKMGVKIKLGLSDAELQRIREMREGLFARWAELPAGETLELEFGDAGLRT